MKNKIIIAFLIAISISMSFNIQDVRALDLIKYDKFEVEYTLVGNANSSESQTGDKLKITEENEAEEFYLGSECPNGCIGLKHSSTFSGNGKFSSINTVSTYATDTDSKEKRKKVNAALYQCYYTGNDAMGNPKVAQTIVGEVNDYLYSTTNGKIDISDCLVAAENADSEHLGNFEFSCKNMNFNLNNYDGFCKFVKSVTNNENKFKGIVTEGAYESLGLELANTCYDENAVIISSNYNLNSSNCPGLGVDQDDKDEIDENKKYVATGEVLTHYQSISYLNYLNDVYSMLNGKITYSCGKISQDGKTMTISSEYDTYEKAKSGCIYGLTDIVKTKYELASKIMKTSSNSSGTYECKLIAKNKDTGDTYTQEVMGTISFDSERMKVAVGANVPKITSTLKFTFDEVKKILDKDESMYRTLGNTFYTTDPNATCKAVAFTLKVVVPIVVVVGGIVATVASGGGAGAVVGAALGTIWSSKSFLALSIISGIVLENACKGVEYVKEFVGTGGGEVFHSYGVANSSVEKTTATCTPSNKQSSDDGELQQDYEVTCDNIMSGEFGKIIKTIMNIIRFAGVALLVLLGALDFIIPIVSGDQESLKKSGGKFVKRIIVLVLILFVPVIVELLLSLIGRSCSSGL